MPAKTSRRKTNSGISVLALLAFVAAILLYQSWQENQGGNLTQTAAETTAALVTQDAEETGAGQPTQNTHPTTTTRPAVLPAAFFSNPLSSGDHTAEDALVQAIGGARKTIDMAIYNLSLTSVTDALITAQARGVKVRLVMESQSISRNQPQRLIQAGIPIHGDEREGLMHNKFTIIDRQDVWMGSMNYTSTSFYKDFNNLVHLPSSEAAQDYTTEFNEMFDDNLFGSDTRAATPYPLLTIGDVQVEIYFSPDDGVADQVIEEIRSARTSIDFLAYSFTSNDIADAVRERAAAGVQVRGVFDEEQVTSNTGGEYDALRQAGISVRRDGISGLMHSKVFIIDGKTVITGSYNFSSNAERVNDENLVILHDPSLGEQYTQNFEAIYANAK